MKKIFLFLLFAAGLCVFGVNSGLALPILSFEIEDDYIETGELFTVDLVITDNDVTPIDSWEFKGSYDADVMQIMSVENGDMFDMPFTSLNLGTDFSGVGGGVIPYVWAIELNTPGNFNGILAALNFMAKESGQSAIILSDVLLGNPNAEPVSFTDNTSGEQVIVNGGVVPEPEVILFFGFGAAAILLFSKQKKPGNENI